MVKSQFQELTFFNLLKPVLKPRKEYAYINNYQIEENFQMKNKLSQLSLLGTKINRRHVQLIWAIIALALLVLGIGAPADGGGISI